MMSANCLFPILRTRSASVRRPSARICDVFATESFGRPVTVAGNTVLPGASAHARLLVGGTHTTVEIRLRFNGFPRDPGLRNEPRLLAAQKPEPHAGVDQDGQRESPAGAGAGAGAAPYAADGRSRFSGERRRTTYTESSAESSTYEPVSRISNNSPAAAAKV